MIQFDAEIPVAALEHLFPSDSLRANECIIAFPSQTGLPLTAALTHSASLLTHIGHVRRFGEQFKVPAMQLVNHDLSKWQEDEFVPYAKWFQARPEDLVERSKVKREFDYAVLKHWQRNDHHWTKYVNPLNGDVYPMPTAYAREMVADWHGASAAYGQGDNIHQWLSEKASSIVLHQDTADFVTELLCAHGYPMYAFKYAL